jgi:hypothetical protein
MLRSLRYFSCSIFKVSVRHRDESEGSRSPAFTNPARSRMMRVCGIYALLTLFAYVSISCMALMIASAACLYSCISAKESLTLA